jgi:RNA polymerase sigma-70 factor (ECF subfamily)
MATATQVRDPATSNGDTSISSTRSRPVEEDWRLAYDTYARPIFRYLLRLTLGNRGEAEDYLQETFLRAWRWLQSHPLDLEGIRPWLYTVARHIVIDAVRSRQVRPVEVVIDDMALVASAENDIERLVQVQAVRGALLLLSEDHRAALVELYYHEHTAKEAASVLGIPAGTVKSRAHNALRALRMATLAAEREGQRRHLHRPPAVRPDRRACV